MEVGKKDKEGFGFGRQGGMRVRRECRRGMEGSKEEGSRGKGRRGEGVRVGRDG